MYIEPLIGAYTVNTMPVNMIPAFAHHGKATHTVDKGAQCAASTLRELSALDIDLDQVTTRLENESIQKLIKPYDATMRAIEVKRLRWGERDVVEERLALRRTTTSAQCDQSNVRDALKALSPGRSSPRRLPPPSNPLRSTTRPPKLSELRATPALLVELRIPTALA